MSRPVPRQRARIYRLVGALEELEFAVRHCVKYYDDPTAPEYARAVMHDMTMAFLRNYLASFDKLEEAGKLADDPMMETAFMEHHALFHNPQTTLPKNTNEDLTT